MLDPRHAEGAMPVPVMDVKTFNHQPAFLPSLSIHQQMLSRRKHHGRCRTKSPASLAFPKRQRISSHRAIESPSNSLTIDIREGSDTKLFETMSPSRASLFVRVLRNRTRHITFVLDLVHGAHNLAAITRSCDAFGVQDLHVIGGKPCRSPGEGIDSETILERFNTDPSIKNVSKNAHKWLTIAEHETSNDCSKTLRNLGYKIYVSSLSPDAVPIHSLDVSERCAFVFGNERDGVTLEMQRHADCLFTIPMVGFVESMNVSVAVATSAATTVPRCLETVSKEKYFLSPEERRALAHDWLAHRFSQKQTAPKPLPSRQDVTHLGNQMERLIIERGLFANIKRRPPNDKDLWKRVFRFATATGGSLATYFAKRKFGALGDIGYDRRGKSISFFIAGTHALSCQASFASSPLQFSRGKLVTYFRMVCDKIQLLYAPYFDEFGTPNLPYHAPESHAIFSMLAKTAQQEAFPVCVEFAKDLLGMTYDEVIRFLGDINYLDLSRCISATVRLSPEGAEKFTSLVSCSAGALSDVQSLVRRREPNRILWESYARETDASLRQDWDSTKHFVALQVFLRLSQAAFLCSEMHQAVWDGASKPESSTRIRCRQFGLLESVISEAASEIIFLEDFDKHGALRLVFELDQALIPLQQRAKQIEEEDEKRN